MLRIGRGQGELWKGDTFLCKTDYDIGAPLTFGVMGGRQHVKLVMHDYDCEELLTVAGLTLILADGSRHRLPQLTNFVQGDKKVECFLSADV
jgi:hypothetical protein